jgi:hypothetical protein
LAKALLDLSRRGCPVGSVVACGLIAYARGCRLDERSVHRCVINGKDYEQLLAKICQLLRDPKKPSQRTWQESPAQSEGETFNLHIESVPHHNIDAEIRPHFSVLKKKLPTFRMQFPD